MPTAEMLSYRKRPDRLAYSVERDLSFAPGPVYEHGACAVCLAIRHSRPGHSDQGLFLYACFSPYLHTRFTLFVRARGPHIPVSERTQKL